MFYCVQYVPVSGVSMSGLYRPVHAVHACLGKFLARCRMGVRCGCSGVFPVASRVSDLQITASRLSKAITPQSTRSRPVTPVHVRQRTVWFASVAEH